MGKNSQFRLFTDKQVFITTVIGGPLASGLMLAFNFKTTGQKKKTRLVKWMGILAQLLIMILNIFIAETNLFPGRDMDDAGLKGLSLVILLFLFFHILLAIVFWFNRSRIRGSRLSKIIQDQGVAFSFFRVLPYLLLGLGLTVYFIISGLFWFIFTVIYLLPNIYLYNHIIKLIRNRKLRIVFTFLFVFLVVLFPAGEALEHSNISSVAQPALWVGYYYLPVLLYLFLFYLLYDLIKLLIRMGKPSLRAILNEHRSRLISFIILVFVTAGITGKGIYNFNHPQIHTYTIEIPQKQSHIENLSIAMAADFHFSDRTGKKFIRCFVEKMNSINPDLVLLPGDLIETMPGKKKKGYIQNQLRKIESAYGVFAVEGNHELYGDNGKTAFFDKTGIMFLKDTVRRFDKAFYLVGRKDRHNRERKDLKQLLHSTSGNLPVIVMDHQPYELKKAAGTNIDIHVSGHTHHGQLFPFNYITEAIYRISWGHEKINNTHFFVTCGAQGWGPPVKTSSYSEIMEIKINFTE